MPRARRRRARTSLAVGAPARTAPSDVGLVVGELLEEPGGRGHGHGARRDVDLGHDRGHERHHDLAALRLHDEQVLRGQVVDVGDLADLHAVAHDARGRRAGGRTRRRARATPGRRARPRGWPSRGPRRRCDRRRPRRSRPGARCTSGARASVEALAVPRRRLGHLQRELGARHEAALGVVGVELELDGALQAVRLGEAADPELCSGCVGHVSRRCRRRRRARGGRRRAR